MVTLSSSMPTAANRYDAFASLNLNDGLNGDLKFQQTGSIASFGESCAFGMQQKNTINNSSSIPTKDNIFPEMKPIASNADNLDGLITNFNNISNNYNNGINTQNDVMSQTLANQKTIAGNPFANPFGNPCGQDKSSAFNGLNELDLTASMLNKSMENYLNGVNYDALRDTMTSETNKLIEKDNQKTEKNAKKEVPIDLFKDAASAAFSEFESSRNKNNEFYNKISGIDYFRNGFDGGKIMLK